MKHYSARVRPAAVAASLPPVAVAARAHQRCAPVAPLATDSPGIEPPPVSEASGRCPFLAAATAAPPPIVRVPLWARFEQLFAPQRFQARLAAESGGAPLVAVPKQLGFAPYLMVATPDLVREVFGGEAAGMTRQADIPSFVTLMGEDSLVLVQEPRHRQLRMLVQPAFSKEAVATYLPDIQALVQGHLQDWAAAGSVKGYDGIKRLTFDFIISITMGRRYNSDELAQLSKQFATWTSGFLAWPWLDLPFTPYARSLAARRDIAAHFQAAIDVGRSTLAAGGAVPGILGNLLAAVDDDGQTLTDKEIVDNIILLLLAGHDTSSTTLTSCVSQLHDHPEVVAELRKEQAAVVALHGDAISAAAIRDMPYADAVIRETLRVSPVVAALFRVAARDITLAGHEVAEGTYLWNALHHTAVTDERWATATGPLDPSLFNPERMLGEEGQKPGAQLPFGYGPRFCVGAALAMAEMKVFLAVLLRDYDFTADNNTTWRQAVGSVPDNGLPLSLTPLASA